MSRDKDKVVACPFYGNCENADIECYRCRYNANFSLGNFLVLKNKEGKTIRFLEG